MTLTNTKRDAGRIRIPTVSVGPALAAHLIATYSTGRVTASEWATTRELSRQPCTSETVIRVLRPARDERYLPAGEQRRGSALVALRVDCTAVLKGVPQREDDAA